MLRCVLPVLAALIMVGVSASAQFSHSSYLVVFTESPRLSGENMEIYSQRLKKELDQKILKMQSGQGLLGVIEDEDRLWISQSVRLDLSLEKVQQIARTPGVLSVMPDEVVFLEQPVEVNQQVSAGSMTYGLDSLEVPEVWEKYGLRGEGVSVGVMDTGWSNHADLAGKVIRSKDFISTFEENQPNDDQGHGTHCMGTIGGGSASGKAIGIAPDVKFIVAKIFDSRGRSSRSAILKAMQWITDPDGDPETRDFPRVISNSWGKQYEGFENETQYRRATRVWREFGIAPVFAAGNAGLSKNAISSPAALDSTLAVAAVDHKDEVASFSSRGPVQWENGLVLEKPDVTAPGVKIYSASYKGGYVSYSGTSMACPHVAGVVALMLQANPNLSVDEIFSILRQSATELGKPGWDSEYGYGKISALRAVEIAQSLGYVSIKVSSQGAPVRVRVVETGQVHRFSHGESFKLHLKEGFYHLMIQSFGSGDQSVDVEVKEGELTSVSLELEKAPTVRWQIRIVNDDGEPMEANIHFPDIPVGVQKIEKEGSELELPAANYTYTLIAHGYARVSSEIHLGGNMDSTIEMRALKPLLIVNATKDETLSRYIKSAIPRDYSYEYSNKYRTLSLEDLQGYRRVMWFTGNRSTGALNFAKRSILQSFFEDGGTIILSGQNLQENIGNSNFTQPLFGIKVTQKSSSRKRLRGLGMSMVINESSSAKNQNSPEELSTVSDEASILLKWDNRRGALSERIHGDGRAYYLGFGIEGLSRLDRISLMKHLLERSQPSLMGELERAGNMAEGSLRSRVINAARHLKVTGKSEAEQGLKLLREMNLQNSVLFQHLDARAKFFELHTPKLESIPKID